jgi:hypothetical protein
MSDVRVTERASRIDTRTIDPLLLRRKRRGESGYGGQVAADLTVHVRAWRSR